MRPIKRYLKLDSPLEKQAFSASKGCLMLQLPEPIRERIREWKTKNIPTDQKTS